jgi:AP2 domain/HNH endonuclease
METVTIRIDDKEIVLDRDDYVALPKNHYFKIDKDGYALVYFYSIETRREENFRLSRWVLHNPKGLLVDHINGTRLDNRKVNLRAVNAKQNTQNSKPRKNTSSRFKGVCSNKQGKWQAQIKINNKSFYLGQYSTEEEAAKAYDKAAQESFGEFAYLNFRE